ncbi:I11RA protein, partial [Polypterus senegalus]
MFAHVILENGNLILTNTDSTMEGNYSCHNKKNQLLKAIFLRLGMKPDPPEFITTEPIPNYPKRLRVLWKYPASWPEEDHFRLKFQLEYKPLMLSSWSVVETTKREETLKDVLAGHIHVIRVRAKDFLDAGNWSDWSPEITAQAWIVSNNEQYENVALLVSLGSFAGVILALLAFFAVLVCPRSRPFQFTVQTRVAIEPCAATPLNDIQGSLRDETPPSGNTGNANTTLSNLQVLVTEGLPHHIRIGSRIQI